MKETSVRKTFTVISCFLISTIMILACTEPEQPSTPLEASSEPVESIVLSDPIESKESPETIEYQVSADTIEPKRSLDAVEPTTTPETEIIGIPMIKLTTTLGTIAIELDFENAPNTAANFQQYCEEGFYEGTIFHRVINGFMVQGGGMNEDMSQKETRAPIENEADNGLQNVKGSLAMARTGDPHSATAQFFINVADNDFLNHTGKNPQGWGYAVFGKIVEGMDVVDAMKAVKTGSNGGHRDVPEENIVIEKCEVTEG